MAQVSKNGSADRKRGLSQKLDAFKARGAPCSGCDGVWPPETPPPSHPVLTLSISPRSFIVFFFFFLLVSFLEFSWQLKRSRSRTLGTMDEEGAPGDGAAARLGSDDMISY